MFFGDLISFDAMPGSCQPFQTGKLRLFVSGVGLSKDGIRQQSKDDDGQSERLHSEWPSQECGGSKNGSSTNRVRKFARNQILLFVGFRGASCDLPRSGLRN